MYGTTLKSELYLPQCTLSKLTDEARYAFVCGAMAASYDAQMVRSIDRRITNRALRLSGGWDARRAGVGGGGGGGARANASNAGPFKLRFLTDHKRLVPRAAARGAPTGVSRAAARGTNRL